MLLLMKKYKQINKQLEYDIDKDNPDLITGDTWYNTSICKKYMEQCLNFY